MIGNEVFLMKKMTIGKVLVTVLVILAIVFLAASILAHFFGAMPGHRTEETVACVLALL